VKIVLSRGRSLKLRIVNRSGHPIPKAQLLQASIESSEAPALVKASFSMKADADGRIFWDQAPDREIAFDIAAPGYMRTNEYRVRSDGQEHTVILPPALRIHGTVSDAQTGEPLPHFRLITGQPQTSFGPNGTVIPWWSPIPRDSLDFSDGKFDHAYEEFIVYNEKNPRFMFKFEADGYAPFVTRIVNIDEEDVRFDIQLRPRQANFVTVLLPDGRPCGSAEIDLAHAGQHVPIADGGLALEYGVIHLATDREGRFDFQPEPITVRVFAASPDGFGSATPDELAVSPILRLQAWATFEGRVTRQGKPVEGLSIVISPPPMIWRSGEPAPAPFLSIRTRATTDAQGRFSFAKVPPGKFTVSAFSPSHENGLRFGQVELRPGDRNQVELSEEEATADR
jgi:hypothetical protein